MKKSYFLVFFLVFTASLFAQTRADIKVNILPVKANAEHAEYFQKNFTMETIGAGYTLAENSNDADYSLALEVKPNMILYDDGTEEQAPPDEKQSVLQVGLIRNEDNIEMVSFAFPFTDVNEMNDFNLYLLYEAMANVPFTKETESIIAEEDDSWRKKWLYIRASFDYPITFYELLEPSELIDNTHGEPRVINLNHRVSPFPAATLGLELQYLNWMSTEVDFQIYFSDPIRNSFIPTITIEQKFPIKPGKIFMLEPYLAVSFPMTTTTAVKQFPRWGAGGGFQLGVKGGNMGAFFVDVNFIYFLDNVIMKNPYAGYTPEEIHYRRYVVGLGIGYKIGLFTRPVRN